MRLEQLLNLYKMYGISEQAFDNDKAKEKFYDISQPLFDHWLKLLAFDDERSLVHHHNDMESWILQLSKILRKAPRWHPGEKELLLELYNREEDESDIDSIIGRMQRGQYSSLTRLYSNQEIKIILPELYTTLAQIMLEYKNDIRINEILQRTYDRNEDNGIFYYLLELKVREK